MSDKYTSAPLRIRWARIGFAFAALAGLISCILILTLHPSVTPQNDSIANMGVGALISLNMITFKFLFDSEGGTGGNGV